MFKYMSITKDTDRAKRFFENFLSYTTTAYSLKQLMKKDITSFNLVDVRSHDDYKKGHIPTAIHIAPEKITQNLHKLNKEKPTIVYCYERNCHLAKTSSMVFLENYFPTIELEGGFKSWKEHDYEIAQV